MTLAPALHVALLAVAVLTTATLTGYAWRHQTWQAARSFGALMAGFTLYSVAHLVGLLTFDPAWRLFWENLQWTGTAVIPLFWLLFAMAYTGYDEMLTWRGVGVLAAVPLVTIVLAWTNSWHGLMWTENALVAVEGLAVLEQPFGPWAVLSTVVGYGMLGTGAFLILRLVWLSDRLYAGQAALLIPGVAVPVLASIMTMFGLTPIRDPPIDMTPYAFSVTGLVFGYALFRRRLFELVPATQHLGRDVAIRDLKDGTIIVDADYHVVYCNPAAGELLDCEPGAVLGEPVDSVFEASLEFDAGDTLELEHGDRILETHVSSIRDRLERRIGHTLVIQDVTRRTRRERRLARQRDELDRLDELNTVIRGVNRALVSATSREEIERAVCTRLADSDRYRAACMADIPT